MKETSILFDRSVEKWLQYSESLKGQLRSEIIAYHLEQCLHSTTGRLRVLDAGCGLGDMASLLLERAREMVLLDSSEGMLKEAKRRIAEKRPATDYHKVMYVLGQMEDLDLLVPNLSFDLITCHNSLEYVESPMAALAVLASRLVEGGLLSVVAANRFSEPLKLALVKGDLRQARLALSQRSATADLFEHATKHTFSLKELEEMLGEVNLNVLMRRGIRIFTDYLPEKVVKEPGSERLLFDLEKEAAAMEPYLHVARYLQLICQKPDSRE